MDFKTTIIAQLLDTFVPIVAVGIAGLLARTWNTFAQGKQVLQDLQIHEQEQKVIANVIEQSISYAHEQYEKDKKNTATPNLTGAEKQQIAANFARKALSKAGLLEAAGNLVEKIEAQLPQVRNKVGDYVPVFLESATTLLPSIMAPGDPEPSS